MYLALILLFIILYYCSANKSNPRTIKNYIKFVTVVLILVSGLRHEAVGNDTYAYMLNFDDAVQTPWSDIFSNFWDLYLNPGEEGKDPGELVIIKAFTYILPNARFFLFVVAAILLIPLGVFVYRNSKSLETPCFFYVFYITMFYPYLPNSAIRQSFALAILLLGYLLLQKRKLIPFILLLLIATLVHKSILITFLILPYYFINKPRLLYYASFGLFILMLFYYQYIGVYLASQSEIYEMYASGAYLDSAPFMVILMILGLYVLGCFGIMRDSERSNNRIIYGGAAMTLVWVVLVRLNPSLIRLIAYFGPWMGIMVPLALKQWRPKDYKIFFAFILIIFVLRAIITPDNYHFMWQEMELHDRY